MTARQTEFRFSGHAVRLNLSPGLFSSAGVDTGSMLLLKTVAHIPKAPVKILDTGCGAGTLGLALAATHPEAGVTMIDRDELAVRFSESNACLNGLKNVSVLNRLLNESLPDADFDLIVSNFPAKAGQSVLEHYIRRSMDLLTSGGRAVIVIVAPLADVCRQLISQNSGRIIVEESTTQHSVFHYQPSGHASGLHSAEHDSDLLKPYIRRHGEFKIAKKRCTLETVWNIPGFDTLSWRQELMAGLLKPEHTFKTAVFSEPGQGHIPVFMCSGKYRPRRVILTGRDRLALLISARNLPGELPVETIPLADPSDMSKWDEKPGFADFLFTDLNPVPGTRWAAPLKEAALRVLKSGAYWAICGRSSALSALNFKGFTPIADRRNRGERAVVYQKN